MKKHNNSEKKEATPVLQVGVYGVYSKFWKVGAFSVVGITSALTFALLHFYYGYPGVGFYELFLAMLSVFNLIAFSYHRNTNWSSWGVLSLMVCLLLVLLLQGGFGGLGALWFALFPPLAFFMEGIWSGTLWCGFLLLILLFSSFLATSSLANFFYTSEQILLISAMYVALSLVVFAFEWAVEKTHEALVADHAHADQVNGRLEKELKLAKSFEVSGSRALQELEDTKRAILNVLEDVEQGRKEAAEQSSKNEAILRDIADAVAVTDKDGVITFVNIAFERLLGFSEGEVLGKKFTSVVPSQDAMGVHIADTHRVINYLLSPDFPTDRTSYELKDWSYVRKDGTVFPVEGTVAQLWFEGNLSGSISVFRDVTKIKEVEKMRADFLTLTSHQLRTPLSGTKWLIETLQRGILGKLNAKQKSYLSDIHRSNERMIKLVVDMLNTLRLEGGSVILTTTRTSAQEVLEHVAASLNAAAQARDVELVVLPTKEKLFIQTDVDVLHQVVDAFVSNAINYTPQGEGKKVTLTAHKDKNLCVFEIKDQGIGVPPDEKQHIFDRFYRATNAKAHKPDGTGLGLYIAKLLSEKLGGSVTFISEEGKGSTFSTLIPLEHEGGVV